MERVTNVQKMLLIILLIILTSCDVSDIHSDSYNEKDTLDLFVGIPRISIANHVEKIRIYRVNHTGFFSEEFLKRNDTLLIEINEKKTISKIIKELHHVDPEPIIKDFHSENPEYHIIFILDSGRKAYLRLSFEKKQNNIVEINPLAPMIYYVPKPLILFEIIDKFNDR